MNETQRDALAVVTVLAAMADGVKSESERDEVKRIASAVGVERLSTLYVDALSGRTTLESATAALDTDESRTLAYEMAVCVCDADGALTPAERDFLGRLRGLLKMAPEATGPTEARAGELAVLAQPGAGGPGAVVEQMPARPGAAPAAADTDTGPMILNYSILTGALELLPQNLATLAIIPLQTKMVYRIGKRHGHSLGTAHIKEFIAAVGVGMTGQVLEGYARRLFGSLGKKIGGSLAGKVASTAAGAGLTFATTWAMGQVAQSYYAGGRRLSVDQLRSLFKEKTSEAQRLYETHRPAIEAKARTLNPADLPSLIRGA